MIGPRRLCPTPAPLGPALDQSLRTVRDSTRPGRGILWMLVAMALFIGLDTMAKYLSQSYPVLQIVWARYFFHVLILGTFLAPRLISLLRTNRLGLQILRSIFLLGATGFFFTAISFMPLANASAIMFVSPLLVTALSTPLLGERVGPHRWASVVVGFVGAIIIIRPGSAAMEPAALLALGAACSYSLYQITTRRLAGVDRPLTTLAYSASVGTLVTGFGVPLVWVPPAVEAWIGFVMLGVLGAIGHFALIKAFETAPAATVTPFSYSSLIWATLLGFVVFDELPDGWTVFGAVIIAASGLYIVHRERVRKLAGAEPR